MNEQNHLTDRQRFFEPHEAIFTIMLFGILPLLAIIWSGVARSNQRQAHQKIFDSQNIRIIAQAIRNYQLVYNSFPPAYTVDKSGNKLHSWRTLLLPFLDQSDLYEKIDLSKPWDAPENAAARADSVALFETYGRKLPAGQTLYHLINHPQGIFNGPKRTRQSAIKDAQTLLVIQAATTQPAHWMQPDEYSLQDLLQINATNASGTEGQTHIALADGSEHQLCLQDLTPDQITGLVTIAENEPPIPALKH